MAGDTTKDMTQGSPMKLILGFSIPLLFGFLFQQFYNVMDTIIVGRVLGVNALAGVGSTGSLNFFIKSPFLSSISILFNWAYATDLQFLWRISLARRIIPACGDL